MPWTERQAQMLEAMGLRVWQAPPPAGVSVEPAAPAAPTVARAAPVTPVRSPPPAPAPAPSPAPIRPPIAPMPEHIAMLDWPGLRQAVAGCRACSLCDSRKQTVFGAGDERAHWFVVGEAPGEQEDAQGEPFVGPAGQLLDRMLHALQLTRRSEAGDGDETSVPLSQRVHIANTPLSRRVYIANTLKCRPPHNRNPTPDEVAHCLPHLTRQLELLRPRIVLLMGRFAVQALLGSDEPLGKLRGRVHLLPHGGGTPAVVTYHPSYLLRSPLEKAKAWEDLCLAAATCEAAASAGA